jgi:hypothetical protein
MDSARFDSLVRTLGQARSRRQTLRGLAGAGAALLLGLPVATTLADCQRQCEEKDQGALRRCRERCRDAGQRDDQPLTFGVQLPRRVGHRHCENVDKVPDADLRDCTLQLEDLEGVNLYRANLSYADLSFTKLQDANLIRANLTGARLWATELDGAFLWSADLTGAELHRTASDGTVGWEAQLDGASFCETTMPDGTTRSDGCDDVCGLPECESFCRSFFGRLCVGR